jgi:hypothetical protein
VTRTGLLNDLPCNNRYAFFCEMELMQWQIEETKAMDKEICFITCARPILVLFRKPPLYKECLLLS